MDYILKLVDISIENREISLSINMTYFSIIVSIITLLFTFLYSENNNYLISVFLMLLLFTLLELFLIYSIKVYLKIDIKYTLKLKNFKRYLENEIENINKIEKNQK